MKDAKGQPSSSTAGLGCMTVVIGGAICVFAAPIGILIGAPLVIYGAIRGSTKQRGLQCINCANFIARP